MVLVFAECRRRSSSGSKTNKRRGNAGTQWVPGASNHERSQLPQFDQQSEQHQSPAKLRVQMTDQVNALHHFDFDLLTYPEMMEQSIF